MKKVNENSTEKKILLFDQLFFHMVSKKKQQDSMDPLSFDSLSTLEDWITGKDICLEDYGSSDWMAVEPPSGNPIILGSSDDEVEELAGGNYSSSSVEKYS